MGAQAQAFPTFTSTTGEVDGDMAWGAKRRRMWLGAAERGRGTAAIFFKQIAVPEGERIGQSRGLLRPTNGAIRLNIALPLNKLCFPR